MIAPEDLKHTAGGCNEPCGGVLPCGHRCKELCHSYYHEIARCREPCLKAVPGCGHECYAKCFDKCYCQRCEPQEKQQAQGFRSGFTIANDLSLVPEGPRVSPSAVNSAAGQYSTPEDFPTSQPPAKVPVSLKVWTKYANEQAAEEEIRRGGFSQQELLSASETDQARRHVGNETETSDVYGGNAGQVVTNFSVPVHEYITADGAVRKTWIDTVPIRGSGVKEQEVPQQSSLLD